MAPPVKRSRGYRSVVRAEQAQRTRERIVEAAFDYAKQNGRRKVTAAHKANIMKFSDGLFLETAREVAKRHPEIEFEDRIIDNLCNQLVSRPEEFYVARILLGAAEAGFFPGIILYLTFWFPNRMPKLR